MQNVNLFLKCKFDFFNFLYLPDKRFHLDWSSARNPDISSIFSNHPMLIKRAAAPAMTPKSPPILNNTGILER